MAIDEKLALRAYRIFAKVQDNKAVAKQLGLGSAREAVLLINVGRRLNEIQASVLTESELQVLRILATLDREALSRGQTSTRMSKEISWRARRSAGWAGSVCKKRLVPYGFIEHSANGHIWLMPAGMAAANCLMAPAQQQEREAA